MDTIESTALRDPGSVESHRDHALDQALERSLERGFELRFQSLFHAGKALAFPCNARGEVSLDALSERARENYLFARAVVGHEYAAPVVTSRA